MNPLDDLLKKALAEKASTDTAKAEKARLRDSRLTARERDEIASKVREWESAHEYVTIGFAFRLNRFCCMNCGSAALAGGQLLEQQKHIRMAGTQRYIAASWAEVNSTLPKAVQVTEVKVPICNECCGGLGFKGAE